VENDEALGLILDFISNKNIQSQNNFDGLKK
jgi:hypothetical protein